MLKAESTKPSYARIMGLPPRGYHRRWPRIVLRCLVGLVLVVVLAVGAGVLWLRSAEMTALPVLDGDLHIDASDGSGLSAPVTVRRDAHGVPHIEAANQSDLFVAQGYVTAQDRLWQMDALRRNANGELAEVFGSSLLAHDKAQRVFQFRRTAERIYANQTPVYRARLDDYAHGVNLFIAQHANSLPAEFRLLHYRPKPWTGVDSVSIGLILAQGLDMHWEPKLAREHIAAELHNPKLEADLYPVGSWRDHAPTGTVVDWSQPHPAPPAKPGSDDDDDDRSQASTKAPSKTDNLLRVKSTGFSPYNSSAESRRASRAAETLDLAAISRGFVTGHDFSRAASAIKPMWALAPEGSFKAIWTLTTG
jgi:penicillin amidase